MSDCLLCGGKKVIRATIAERMVSGIEWLRCPHCLGEGVEPPVAIRLRLDTVIKEMEAVKVEKEEGLARFGVELPPVRSRGREKVGKANVEVHRAGPNEFSILRTESGGARREERAKVVDVEELWRAINSCLSGGSNLTDEQKLSTKPRLSSRQVMKRLWEMQPPGSHQRAIDVSAWQGGEYRAAYYFPLYYRPLLVLDLFYRVVERSGRTIRVVKAFAKLDEEVKPATEPTTLGDDFGPETVP